MWKTEALTANSFRASIPMRKHNSWEAWALLTSDRHWDNPKSDWSLQKAHLDQVKERDAIVIDAGDFFCAMQGKYDKRASKASVRPEHQVDNYLDSLPETAAKFFKPYHRNLFVIGSGNHESSIKSKHEVDLTERFVTLLNVGQKHRVFNGHFGGYVFFSFINGKISAHPRIQRTIKLKYVHGWGGGGPITQDMIQASRRAMVAVDADIILSGHTHDSWVMDRQVERVSHKGEIRLDTQTHIKTPTYKEEYGTGKGGWHVETGKPPKPLGAYWLRFYWSNRTDTVEYEVIRAR